MPDEANTMLGWIKSIKNCIYYAYDSITKTLRVSLVDSEIKLPIDVQDHWAEAVTLLASAARTADGTGADIDVGRFICGVLCINVTAASGTFDTGQGLTIIVEGKDEVTGLYKEIYNSGVVTAAKVDWLEIDTLPFRLVRVRWTISGTTPSFTFSVTMQAKA